MQYARICVEVVGEGPLPTKLQLNYGKESKVGSAEDVEIEVKYHWKPPRCASCKKSGHSAAQCKSKKFSKPIEGAKSVSQIKLDPVSKIINSGANPSAVDVSRVCLPDPSTSPWETSTTLMERMILDGFANKAKT
ncbi:hypothetical protein Nepgr_018783 [Nepenthes gracilis]|uniref:Uncharacterized protein n=1 Tax=Nepenthes gracilis TaxID=150966 RepID=A0AAD3STP9_NEPGR|nr:hypothetical protein Nepgr_018783 [Nepenthes gracilis]